MNENNTSHQHRTAAGEEHDPATVASKIETLERRIRTRSRILSGDGLSHGHGESPQESADRIAEQRKALHNFEEQLADWKSVRDRPTCISGEHVDQGQRYEGGQFITSCSCGEAANGVSPDDADAAQLEHVDEYVVPVDPMADLECDSCQ